MNVKEQVKTVALTAVFLGLGLILFITVSYIVRPIDDTCVRERVTGFYAVEQNSLDLVTIGSSSVYRYIDVPFLYSKFGYTSYTLGTPGQSFHAYQYLIDEVEKTQHPKLYLIDSRRYIKAEPNKKINTKRLMELAGNMKYSRTRTVMVREMSVDIKDPLPYYWDLITYHAAWPQLHVDNLSFYKNEKKHALMGWQNMPGRKEIEVEDVSGITTQRPMVDRAEKELRELCEYAREKEIPLLFIGTVYHMTTEQKEVSNTFERIVKEYGMEYLECNELWEEMGLDPETDFYNEYHANCIGARKHTLFLGEYLDAHYQIRGKHTDKVTEIWEETAARDEWNFTSCMEKMKTRAAEEGVRIVLPEEIK